MLAATVRVRGLGREGGSNARVSFCRCTCQVLSVLGVDHRRPYRTTSPISSMPPRDLESNASAYYLPFYHVLQFTILYKIVGNQSPSAPNQQSNKPIFVDSSGPFFTLYSKVAKDEDDETAKRWQEDAKGILIFVSFLYPHSYRLVHKPEH